MKVLIVDDEPDILLMLRVNLEAEGYQTALAADGETALRRIADERPRLTGRFLLRSGATSEEYFDKYLFESDPVLLRAIAEAMAPLVPPSTDALAGLELGGVPLATALSRETGLATRFVRKEAKAYGTCRLAEGGDVDGARLVVVEDVI